MKKILIFIIAVCCYTLTSCGGGGSEVTVDNVTAKLEVGEDGNISARFVNQNNCIVLVKPIFEFWDKVNKTKELRGIYGEIVIEANSDRELSEFEQIQSMYNPHGNKKCKASDYDVRRSKIIINGVTKYR